MKFTATLIFVAGYTILSATAQTYIAVINNGSVSARFTFAPSDTPGSTAVTYEITGGLTNSTAFYSFHIHNNVLIKPDCLSAGNHLNPTNAPFGQPQYPTVSTETNWNQFEAGDLSGKYGVIQGSTEGTFAPRTVKDPFISLDPTAANSVVGRSIVIHGPPSSARIGCANILPVEQAPSGGSNGGNVAVGIVVALGIVGAAGLAVYYMLKQRHYRRAQSAMQI